MAQDPDKTGREILPIPDIPARAKPAIDARETKAPPIKPLRPPEGAPNVLSVNQWRWPTTSRSAMEWLTMPKAVNGTLPCSYLPINEPRITIN